MEKIQARKKGHRYSGEFKARTLAFIRASGMPEAELHAEVDRLRKEVSPFREERDVLKKDGLLRQGFTVKQVVTEIKKASKRERYV
jgi:hypothetical protein